MKLEKEEEREGEMMRRKVVIRFPIDPMSETLVEVNQAIKASAEPAAKEAAVEEAPVVEEEAKVDKEDEGQARELQEEEVEDESEGDKKEVLNGEKESEPDGPRFSRRGRRIRRPERLLL